MVSIVYPFFLIHYRLRGTIFVAFNINNRNLKKRFSILHRPVTFKFTGLTKDAFHITLIVSRLPFRIFISMQFFSQCHFKRSFPAIYLIKAAIFSFQIGNYQFNGRCLEHITGSLWPFTSNVWYILQMRVVFFPILWLTACFLDLKNQNFDHDVHLRMVS